jgi:hypothetical protein
MVASTASVEKYRAGYQIRTPKSRFGVGAAISYHPTPDVQTNPAALRATGSQMVPTAIEAPQPVRVPTSHTLPSRKERFGVRSSGKKRRRTRFLAHLLNPERVL